MAYDVSARSGCAEASEGSFPDPDQVETATLKATAAVERLLRPELRDLDGQVGRSNQFWRKSRSIVPDDDADRNSARVSVLIGAAARGLFQDADLAPFSRAAATASRGLR